MASGVPSLTQQLRPTLVFMYLAVCAQTKERAQFVLAKAVH